jgi:molybdopterin-containing oxidoreductase family iron-sulfur binding subunit
MDETRRGFLKSAGSAALGIGCGLPLLSGGCRGLQEGAEHETSESSQLAMVVNVQTCLLDEVREACVKACDRAHSIPTSIPDPDDEVKWIWTEEYENAFPDQAHRHTERRLKGQPILVLCNHCTKPPCVKVCPTKATWKRQSDGIVMMDMHRCIGCRYCIAACPYGSRSFNWRDPRPFITAENLNPTYPTRTKGVVEKCDFCAERLRAGKGEDGKPPEPACVEAVRRLAETKPEAEKSLIEKALIFGPLSDPDVRTALDENHTICRRPSLGTEPNVFYIV